MKTAAFSRYGERVWVSGRKREKEEERERQREHETKWARQKEREGERKKEETKGKREKGERKREEGKRKREEGKRARAKERDRRMIGMRRPQKGGLLWRLPACHCLFLRQRVLFELPYLVRQRNEPMRKLQRVQVPHLTAELQGGCALAQR